MVKQYDNLTAEAAAFAIRVHEGQYRKGSGFPYVVHPIGVGTILRFTFMDEELEAAGYLHDVLEDTDVEYPELEDRFGPRVAGLVFSVTRNSHWDLRDYRNKPDTLRLKAADMIDNIRDTARGLEKGHDVWSRFAAGKRKYQSWTKDYSIIHAGLDIHGKDFVNSGDRVLDMMLTGILYEVGQHVEK